MAPAPLAEGGCVNAVTMDPRQLFPLLAIAFVLLALVQGLRARRWRGQPLIWLWLGLCFGAVSLWLHTRAP